MILHNNNNFEWIGERLCTNSQTRSFFDNKAFYRGFKLGEWTVNLEDFVLVKRTGDDDLAQQNYSVARINYLYEDLQPNIRDDPCKAVVQWYAWPINIPENCFYDNIIFDFESDVIEDFRIMNPIVKISNFVGPCHVLYGSPFEIASDVIEKATQDYGVDGLIYLCKYRIVQNSESNSFIEPVEEMPAVEFLVGPSKEQDVVNPNNSGKENKHPSKRHSGIVKKNPTKRKKKE